MKISIITPNYNYANYIGETIQSIINQKYDNFEYIVIDDGSTDNSVQVIQKYVEKYPTKIKLIRQENKGQTPAINVGMKIATGDIIGWINSDDTFCSGVFDIVNEQFGKYPKLDVLYADVNIIDNKGNFVFKKRHNKFRFIQSCFVGFTNIMTSNAVFWKKSTMEKSGIFCEELKCNMDGDFFSRLTRNAKVKGINMPFANFRKQAFTKAAEFDQNWANTVRKELYFELKNSYNRLKIAKIIPFEYSKPIRLFFILLRIFQRLLLLQSVRQRIEKQKYLKKYGKYIL